MAEARTPLAAVATPAPGPAEAAVMLAERRPLGRLVLRADAAAAAVAGEALGAPLAAEAGAVSEAGGAAALRLGPDEWLVVTSDEATAGIADRLAAVLAGRDAALVEVSDAMTAIRVAGPRARDLLAKGCPLDLHPRAVRAGRCLRTLIARAEVVVHQVDDAPAYDLHVAASYAEYLWRWLEDAAVEYGWRVDQPP